MISITVRKLLHKRWLQSALAVAFWLCVWQAASAAVASSLILASPLAVLKTLAGLVPSAAFWHTVCQSTARILAGFFLGLAAGLALACLSAAFAFVRVLLHPLVLTVKSVPVASFTVLALFWLRDAANLSMLISFLMVVPVVYANTLEALLSVDAALPEMAKVFRLGAVRTARYIYAPAAAPGVRAACRVGLGLCWKSGVAAEVIGITSGSLGEMLYNAKLLLSAADLFAWTLVIILLSFGFEKLFLAALGRAEHAVCRRCPPPMRRQSAAPAALRADGVWKSFHGNAVLCGVTQSFAPGEAVCVMAPSGAGKTTLLRLLLGLARPDRGEISPAGAKLSCAFQEERLVPGLSAVGNVLLACPCTQAQAEDAFRALGFEAHTMRQPVCQLSGGQQRRVSLARAMLADSAAVLLDEPFKGLDGGARAAAAAFVRGQAAGRAVVCVTHDAADAGLLAARTVQLCAKNGAKASRST
ncbi:MAG: ATP-binding cassette domain-containing protein [Ruthenibacterium sp.]